MRQKFALDPRGSAGALVIRLQCHLIFGGKMKTLIAFTLISLLSPAAYATEETLKDHMREMSILMETAKTQAANPQTYEDAAESMRRMRIHIIAATALVPPKLLSLEGKTRNLEVLAFHQIMSRLIYMSAAIENALSNDDYVTESYSRERDIENLFYEMAKLMSYAHERFR
jgi:hypothetical protein